MPFPIKKVKNGFKVSSPTGVKSKAPLTKEQARKQQRAIYSSYLNKKKKVKV